MDMVEAGEASGAAGPRAGKPICMSSMAAREQWKCNKNGKILRNETLEPVSVESDWRSRIEQTVRQQALEVTQLHQTIDRMARMLEAHTVWEEVQWCRVNESLEDRETKLDDCHWENIL
jgi:hypothetical protein